MRPFRCPELRPPRQLTLTAEDQSIVYIHIYSIRCREEFPGLLTRTSATSALALNGDHVEGETSQEKNEFHCEEVFKTFKQFQLIDLGKCRRFYSKSSVCRINSLTAVPQFC